MPRRFGRPNVAGGDRLEATGVSEFVKRLAQLPDPERLDRLLAEHNAGGER
jgi:hypothetical protein